MDEHPTEIKNDTAEPPAPEVLQPQSDEPSPANDAAASSREAAAAKNTARLRHASYRPSHKATFIGLSVVAAILAINAGIIVFLMNSQNTASAESSRDAVTISPAVLDTLGVSRNPVGSLGTELVVGPNSRFNGKVTMGSDVTIAGQLQLKNKFSANDASLTKLKAGDTSLGQLNVNGDATISNINTRANLSVAGSTRLQGPVTMAQLLTINNNLNVAGNVSVGGVLSARSFQANSLISGSTLTIGGHIISRGSAPGVGSGSGVGSNGTVSISGNDASGTVAVNVGTGGGNGLLAQVAFRSQYGTMPHVVVTPVGRSASVYVSRSIGGFSIGVSGPLSPGGYAFDYIVMQ